MMELYNFSQLNEKLNSLGFPSVTTSRFEIVRKDLSEEINKGNVRFENDGIYLNINGLEHKGYLYIKKPDIKRWGNPKFHITNCETIKSQQASGWFHNRYFWHNSNVVDLEDMVTHERFQNVKLVLCGYCRQQADLSKYFDTQNFFDQLDINQQLNLNVVVYNDGYVSNWRQISKMFRLMNEFTCNRCKLKIENKLDRRFIQVHHLDGNKINNHPSNLECLCVLCHANVDQHHTDNFSNRRNKKEIHYFISKYRNELIKLGNLYINQH